MPLFAGGGSHGHSRATVAAGSYEEALISRLRQGFCAKLKPYMKPDTLKVVIAEDMQTHGLVLPISEHQKNQIIVRLQEKVSAITEAYIDTLTSQYEALRPETGWDSFAPDQALRTAMAYGRRRCQVTTRVVDVRGKLDPSTVSAADAGSAGREGNAIEQLLNKYKVAASCDILVDAVKGGLKSDYHAGSKYSRGHYDYKRGHMFAAMRIVEDVIFNVTGDATRSVLLLTSREKYNIIDTLIKIAFNTPQFAEGKHQRSNPLLYLLAHFQPLVVIASELTDSQLTAMVNKHKPVARSTPSLLKSLAQLTQSLPTATPYIPPEMQHAGVRFP
jgi:hypothetical protein